MSPGGPFSPARLARFRDLLAARGLDVAPAAAIPRRPPDEPLAASFAQERLWFLQQLEPASPAYNLPLALELGGPLRPAVLAASLAAVVSRHEALRTTFAVADGRPVPRVAPPPRPRLPLVDLGALTAARRGAEAQRLAGAEARRPFDLSRGPLLRSALLRLGLEEHRLVLVLHHVAADAWSVGILAAELSALYTAGVEARPAELGPLPIQYGDYARWQRRELAGERLAAHLGWWRQRLAGSPAVLALPTDRPRPARLGDRGGVVSVELPPPLAGRLEPFCRRQGVSLFMALLAAFAALLHRYSGSERVVVGTPVANRGRLETEGLIGLFVNTLALPVDLVGDPAFDQLLARVAALVLGAFEHQELPFERLVEELRPQRDLAAQPLFQTLFQLQSAPRPAPRLGPVEVRALAVASGTAKLDLLLGLAATAEGLVGGFEYQAELFDRPTVARMAGHLWSLLAGALAEPGRRLSQLPLLTAAERQALLREWNDTAAPPPGRCLHQLFEAQVERTPEALALVCERDGAALTYRELNRRANRLARRLRARGVGPETLVGLGLERSAALAVAVLGVLKAGGAYLPLDPAQPQPRLAAMLAASGARHLVGARELDLDGPATRLDVEPPEAGVAGNAAPRAERSREEASPEATAAENAGAATEGGRGEAPRGAGATSTGEPDDLNPDSGVVAENLAYVLFTSGSTGTPKGVALRHAGAAALVAWAAGAFAADELAGVLASTSLGFDLSVFELFVPWSRGGRVILVESALSLSGLPATAQVTLVNTVPSAMEELLRLAALPPCLRVANLAGEPLARALADRLHAHGPGVRVWNLYGPSEASTYSTAALVPPGDGAAPSIGRPIAGTRAYLLDRRLEPVPAGVAAELCLAGAGLARGYLGRPELTAERFVPDPLSPEPGGRLYRTGDLARLRRDGELEFLGRIDRQLKVRGVRIEPGEIEALLLRHPDVAAAAVVPRDDPGAGRSLAACVVAAEGCSMDAAELRAWLRRQLPAVMVPALWLALPALPLSRHGKIDRAALAAAAAAAGARPGAAPAAGAQLPRGAAEEVVAAVWCDLLGRPDVGRHDSFFELGGHSLLATRCVARLRDAFGVELPLRALFETPTVAGVAARLEELLAGGPDATPDALPPPPAHTPLPPGATVPASFAQRRIWLLHELAPAAATYNAPLAARLRGPLDVAALAASLTEVVRRHEALRTTFERRDGEPVQRVAPAAPVVLPLLDLTALPPAPREAQLRRVLAAAAARPFDLQAGPLWSALLARTGKGDHALLLNIHQIAADGWSIGVLLREAALLYGAFARRAPSPLPEPRLQYADFALWQRRLLVGGTLDRQLAWWRNRLVFRPEPPPPLAPARGPGGPPRGGKRVLLLPLLLRQRLEALGRGGGATLFITLLAAFDALLFLRSGDPEVRVGSPTAYRTHSAFEPLIGFFVNTLVLRTDLRGDPTFAELLARVRETALGAAAHQDLPYERLAEELLAERRGEGALFRVWFTLQNFPLAEVALPGLEISPLELAESATPGARFELGLLVWEVPSGLAVHFEYRADLYDDAAVEELAGQFAGLLEAVVARPEIRLAELGETLAAAAARRWSAEGERVREAMGAKLRAARQGAAGAGGAAQRR